MLRSFVLTTACGLLLYTSSTNAYAGREYLERRAIVEESAVGDTYDFIIAGGGAAGLILASRLSANPNSRVLVIEGGESGEAVAGQLNIPSETFFNSLTSTSYDWGHWTSNQVELGGRRIRWPAARVLGGTAATNALYLVRPSEPEIDAWGRLAGDPNRWKWSSFFDTMKKTERFTPPRDDIRTAANIKFDEANHGKDGPIHHSYPGYMPPILGAWNPTLDAVGIPAIQDAQGGQNWGAFITPSAINPSNWTRSFSRTGYIDILPPRGNLHILVGANVTKINFDTPSGNADLRATGVDFSKGGNTRTIRASREVIISAGVMGSPKILQLSGVGPRDVLENATVPVVHELPGVGQNLQDHIGIVVVWNTTSETSGKLKAANNDSRVTTPEFLSHVNDAIAYVNLTTIMGSQENATNFLAGYSSRLDEAVGKVLSNDPWVKEGYRPFFRTTVDDLLSGKVGAIELLFSTMSTSGVVSLQAAIQHPLSKGRIAITTNNMNDPLFIDPNYFSNRADIEILRESAKLIRRIGATEPLRSFLGPEVTPGPNVTSDEAFEGWIRSSCWTQFHYAGSNPMMPLQQGGVVDPEFKVYGLANVRVVDASVYPIHFSAHLTAPTYALAETAATIILSRNNITVPSNAGSITKVASWTGMGMLLAGMYLLFEFAL